MIKERIEIYYYENLLIELLKKLSTGEWKKGKEDDAIIRWLCALLEKNFINSEKLSKNLEKRAFKNEGTSS